MGYVNRRRARSTIALAVASIALTASAYAQTAAPAQQAPAVSQDLAKQHLTAARHTLNEVTQLPAAAKLAGEARTQVQQLISNFNELIAPDSAWRAAYAKVESNLAVLLGANAPRPASATAGAVATSGTTPALDPAIRAKLVEFRAHLDRFEEVAGGAAPSSPEMSQAPAPASPASMIVPGEKPDSPTASGPLTTEAQEVTVVARDLLLHIEALEVILGAQSAAQKAATTAAGGAVVSHETITGSTRTTMSGPDVTLNAGQLAQVKAHLKELRRLLEKK